MRFAHLTFQEYLAARHVKDSPELAGMLIDARAKTGPAHTERSAALCRAFAHVAQVFGALR